MSEDPMRKEYANDEVVVVWQPDLCSHSANCIRGLPTVFDTRRRPWIDPLGASPAAIVEQVRKCPSGALSYRPVAAGATGVGPAPSAAAAEGLPAASPAPIATGTAPAGSAAATPTATPTASQAPLAPAAAVPPLGAPMGVKVSVNGPLLLAGPIRLTLPDGSTVDREGKTALCRCGASTNKPFCDGSHNRVGFAG